MEELSIPYFRDLLEKHIKEFNDYCAVWNKILSSETVPEEVNDEIRTTVGLTNLLMQQKMKQFGELIDDSELKRGEKEITCLDLQGFWDMVYNEVEKIQKSFKKLEKCQNDNWVFVEELISKIEPKKKPALALSTKVTAQAKERAVAARQRLAEAKLKMKAKFAEKENPIEVHVSAAIEKDSTKHIDQISMPREKGMSSIEDDLNSKKQVQPEQPLKVMENIKPTEQNEKVSPSGNLKKTAKMSNRKKNKENMSVPVNDLPKSVLRTPDEKSALHEPTSQSKRKSPKETLPLQCVTRSAKKALLAKENALKSN